MMAPKKIDFTTPKSSRKKVPIPKWWEKSFYSKVKSVTKDLFGTPKKKEPLFITRTLNTNVYKLTGKRLQGPNVVEWKTERLYTKRKQEKEARKPIPYTGPSVSHVRWFKDGGNHYYRAAAAKAEATYRAQKQ